MRFIVIFLLMSISFWAQANPEITVSSQPDAVEEVLVIGEQPGPGLWKVYKGNHVLWILGIHSPLPKNMQWHSKSVETAMTESQKYIAPPRVRVQLNTFQKMTVLPSLIGVRNNPDGEKLSAILSEDIYQRWQKQKEKYPKVGDNTEKWRPIFAMKELYDQALLSNHLTSDGEILYILRKIAAQNKVEMVTPTYVKQFEHPRAIVKQFKKASLDDMTCFIKILERLESGMGEVFVQANAWATGNLAVLRQLPYPNPETICKNSLLNLSLLEDEGIQNIPQLQQDLWMIEAENALANNASTFAALPIVELYKPNGYLAALRTKGYEVEEP